MKNKQNDRILHDICQKKSLFPEFWRPIPSSKAESERTRPQHNQVRDQGGHRSTGAVVLNKPFMRLFTLLYSISLDE